ncbi:helix-turn-helix transcriptional regulator [Fulvivirgaceae bacterium BMA12]|uniref:Helix-turn-helix transcriptional regulator n=1 Tax=Agaribacillus aureus TaxID=3051825 RepID=A0ABT8KYG7_9BACT|nr:helix-turn-helix transcriptional regulator [Fulvivirgaceae bacterium BMA12]
MGRKIGRMREMLGIKQDVVADKLGLSQQAISKIEQSENVDDAVLEKMADALGVSPEAVKNFSEESIFNQINNTLNDSSSLNQNYQCTINPIEKLVEAMEENKKLYEALLKSEREKVAMLQKLLEDKK